MGKIEIVNLKDVAPVDEHGALARALFTREQGSNRIDFLQAELPQGYVTEDAVYPDQDEIVYMLSGEAEIGLPPESWTPRRLVLSQPEESRCT